MVSIHWIDLISYFFKISKFNKPNLINISSRGSSFDNSHIKVQIDKNTFVDIFTSYTTPLLKRKILVFENGIIEQDDNYLIVKGPALNLDKNKFFKEPKIIKKFKINENKDKEQSLKKSVEFFLKIAENKLNFPKKETLNSLKINKIIF